MAYNIQELNISMIFIRQNVSALLALDKTQRTELSLIFFAGTQCLGCISQIKIHDNEQYCTVSYSIQDRFLNDLMLIRPFLLL